MWSPTLIFITSFLNYLNCQQYYINNEPFEILNLFYENLKEDPFLLADNGLSPESRKFIDSKIEKISFLILQKQNAVFSRNKRSVKGDENEADFSINIFLERKLYLNHSDDRSVFEANSNLFAAVLEEKTKLAFYKLLDEQFSTILMYNFSYSTNLAILDINELILVIVGNGNGVQVFTYDSKKNTLNTIQFLKMTEARHINIWRQNDAVYMAVLHQSNLDSGNDKSSLVTIYKWLGWHFDWLQELKLFNVKKTIHFSIHGSSFLVAVKYQPHQDELKSFSDVFKYDIHHETFKLHQRLLTHCGIDIKYFVTELHGENHYFLVTTSTMCQGDNKHDNDTNYKSVLYKYEDQYFIPFQSIQTEAVQWQPIQDIKGHAALIALTPHSLKGFQYDGWQFFENEIVANTTDHALENITTIHVFNYNEEEYLITVCNDCKNTTHIYKVTFSHYNPMKEIHSGMLSWCTNKLKELQSTNKADILGEALRGDLNEKVFPEEEEKSQLIAALEDINNTLDTVNNSFVSSGQSSNYNLFDEDIEVDTVIFNDQAIIKSLKTVHINDIKIDDILSNALDIKDGFKIEEDSGLSFDIINLDRPIVPKIINNFSLEQYFDINNNKNISSLTVNGTVTFTESVHISGTINNITVDEKSLLINNLDQEFSIDVKLYELNVLNLSTKFLNGFDTEELEKRFEQVTQLDKLSVKNLEIGGLINDVSIPLLNKETLRNSGDQIFSKEFVTDVLNVDQLIVHGTLAEKNVPKDFADISGGEFIVNQNVYFKKGLFTNKLEIMNCLNNITVTDGELDILLKDNNNTSTITAKKMFNNLILTNPIIKRHKIKNKRMQDITPVKLDNHLYEINGDVVIEGEAKMMKWFKMEDIEGRQGSSLKNVLKNGVKLIEHQIKPHLTFDYPLDLEDIFADKVNGYNTRDWLLKTSEVPQIIFGKKTFSNSISVDGPVNAFYINDIDVQILQRNSLRIAGDQVIEGDVEIEEFIADNGINSTNSYFGSKAWNETWLFKQNQNSQEIVTINSSHTLNFIKAKNVVVHGLINDTKIEDLVKNLVPTDSEFKIHGRKLFKNLHVKELHIKNSDSDLLKLINSIEENTVTLNGNLNLYNNLSIKNIHFYDRINNLTQDDFHKIIDMKMNDVEDIVTPTDKEYGDVIVLGRVYIGDGKINGKSLEVIANDTVKIDEDHYFENAEFDDSIYIENFLKLDGNIDQLDLENIVSQYPNKPLEIVDKTFYTDVSVKGSLNIESTVNGFDLKNFCTLCQDQTPKSFKIKGKAIFAKGPKLKRINNLDINNLSKKLWFTNKFANITGRVHLEDVIFEGDLNVKEYIDEVNLNIISQNYLSKTKHQIIASNLSFENVTFSNISSPRLSIDGPINGVILKDLLRTVLLQDVEQLFESPVYFENVKVQDLDEQNVYKVNDFDLKHDLMLYNQENIVTGSKYITNLKVGQLHIKNDSHIQNVNVVDWLGNALLKNGVFIVPAKKTFKRAIFQEQLSLRGFLDNQKFNNDTVLLSDITQTISGKKIFHSHSGEVIKFKNLKVKGLINDVDLHELVQDKLNKNKDNILNSKIYFNNSVIVKNINVDHMVDGVNVSELLRDITRVSDLEDFRDRFEKLLDVGVEIENSIKDQKGFFKYFKEITRFNNVYDVFGIRCLDGTFRILTLTYENNTNVFRTHEWDRNKNEFVKSGEMVESIYVPRFIEQVSIEGNDYIYIEHESYSNEQSGGKLLRFVDAQSYEMVVSFPNNATRGLISFVMQGTNQSCLGFISSDDITILCDENGYHSYYLFQIIPYKGLYKATTVTMDQSLNLILAIRQPLEMESAIVVLELDLEQRKFIPIQSIFEGAEANGLTATVIDDIPYIALSLSSQEATVNIGRISVRRLDVSKNQFVQHQHIPLTSPLDVQFISNAPFEPLLLASSGDTSSPCPTFRYDGIAGFKMILRGATLPINSRLRLFTNLNIVAVIQRNTATVLGAVVKGAIRV